LKSDGTVVAWGDNTYGQCDVPFGINSATNVLAKWNYSLALLANGTVTAWGVNDAGQANVPVGLTNVVAVSGAVDYCVALKSDGSIITWGKAPGVPAGLGAASAIAAGDTHTLAITAGKVVAWGDDSSGQIDVPSSINQPLAIGAGWNYSIALSGMGGAVLALASPNLNDGVFTISLPTESGKAYTLEYKSSFTENWSPLQPVTGDGGIITLKDSTASGTQRFYRVQEQ
jgi:hypothetical protein